MNKKTYLYIPLLALIGLFSFTLGKYQVVKPGKGVSIEIPKKFVEMNKENVVKTYGMHSLPLAVYTDESGYTSLSVNMKKDTIKYKGKKGIKNFDPLMERMFLKSTIRQTFTDVNFITDTLFSINGKNIVWSEFTGTLAGEDSKGRPTKSKYYNFIMHGFVKNKKYIFNFSSPQDEQAKYQKVGRYIIQNIKF